MTNLEPTSFPIGKLSMLLIMLNEHPWKTEIEQDLQRKGFKYIIGKVGAMDLNKVIAAIETAAKNHQIIDKDNYHDVHALYHAILEALQGIGRGMVQFGDILRTVGLTFSVVRGRLEGLSENSGEWIAVSIYGTIGAPKKGFEHEAFGFGFNHI